MIETLQDRVSDKTILEHHRLISMILAQADKELLIPYNPASKATPPKAPKKEADYFQPDANTTNAIYAHQIARARAEAAGVFSILREA